MNPLLCRNCNPMQMGKPGCLGPRIHEHGSMIRIFKPGVADTRTRAPAMLLEESADFCASTRRAVLFSLEEVPFRDAVGALEGSAEYRRRGFSWFFLRDVGTKLDGYFRYLQDGRTFDEAFVQLKRTARNRTDPMEQFSSLPFGERARFVSGTMRLTFGVYREEYAGARIAVVPSWEGEVAPAIMSKGSGADDMKGLARGIARD